MAVTGAEFRQNFPEFADTVKYPDAMLDLWLRQAVIQLKELLWRDLWPMGVQLFVAHNLAISAANREAAALGNAPGEVTGPVDSQAVDKVSISYQAGTVSLTDGGYWNLTTYGIQFLQLARMVGSGGWQL